MIEQRTTIPHSFSKVSALFERYSDKNGTKYLRMDQVKFVEDSL